MFGDPQFWILISFLIFVALVFNPVRKILSKNLTEKIDEIKKNLNDAEKLKNESQKTLSEIKKRQNEVKNEIQNISNEAKEKIEILKQNAQIKLKEQINKKNELAKVKIEQMIRETQGEVQQFITTVAINTTIEIIEKKLDENEKQKLINQSIAELNTALKN